MKGIQLPIKLPLRRGGQHESMCEVIDSDNVILCIARPSFPFAMDACEREDLIIACLNIFLAPIDFEKSTDEIIETIGKFTNNERLALISMITHEFCRGCGICLKRTDSAYFRCHCQNDE